MIDDMEDEWNKAANSVAAQNPAKPDIITDRATVDAIMEELAGLDLVAYDRRRDAEAKRIGIRVGTLDQEMAKRRPRGEDDLGLVEPKPWPEPVDGEALLDEISATFARHLVLPAGAADAMALWVLHAHCHDSAEISPLLALTSPAPECGKSSALSLVGALVPSPLPGSNITAAAVFRAIEKWHPTLLVDEADTFLKQNDELRGVINSGHWRRMAFVIRVVGEGGNMQPARFTTWAPKAIAMIGKLPSTLASRSIHIEMRRMGLGETVEPVRLERLDFGPTVSRAARWAKDSDPALRSAEPDVPSSLFGRRADNWRHLVAIADAAGGSWPDRARRAAETLSALGSEQTTGILLLEDIRATFTNMEVDKITSAQLVEKLVDMETRPWAEYSKGKPITTNRLARLLAPFHIQPAKIQFDPKRLQGYEASYFDDAFARYLPKQPDNRSTPHKTAKNQHPQPDGAQMARPVATPLKPAENRHSSGCRVENPVQAGARPDYQPDLADAEDEREERTAIQQFDGDGIAAEFDLTVPPFLDRRINSRGSS